MPWGPEIPQICQLRYTEKHEGHRAEKSIFTIHVARHADHAFSDRLQHHDQC